MSKDKKKEERAAGKPAAFEFSIENSAAGSSDSTSPTRAGQISKGLGLENVESEKSSSKDPLFRLLAEPKLPDLQKKDRAKLQMQSPNRVHFYWSVRSNPYAVLDKALKGRTGSYVLVAKLRNLTTGAEEILPVDAKGDWWFDVDADSLYRADIGFYAPNRPYVQIAFSNDLRTPRKTPSFRTDYTPSFAATAGDFANALDAAGYKKDAFDVALAGDDAESARGATENTYRQLSGKRLENLAEGSESDLRFILLAMAAGYSIFELEHLVDPSLFKAVKKDLESVSAESALIALEENFDVVSDEFEEIEEIGERVFGASLINFPRRTVKRRFPKSLVPKIDEFARRENISSQVRI